MKYSEFIKAINDSDTHFCKISKSSKQISNICCEPFYASYATGKITKGSQLSFIAKKDALNAIPYGDTYTEIDFSNKLINMLLRDNDVKHIGGGLDEFQTPALLIGRQYSLNEPYINALIITNADNAAIASAMNNNTIPKHYACLGFDTAVNFWKEINAQYDKLMEESGSPIRAAINLKEYLQEKMKNMNPKIPLRNGIKTRPFNQKEL